VAVERVYVIQIKHVHCKVKLRLKKYLSIEHITQGSTKIWQHSDETKGWFALNSKLLMKQAVE
jgi:hypothetical protein